jgi:hypothetical protein
MNVASPLTGIRQGMPVRDPAGLLVGYVRDVSGRALLIIESSGPRVFWVEDERVARVEGGAVYLTGPVAVAFA